MLINKNHAAYLGVLTHIKGPLGQPLSQLHWLLGCHMVGPVIWLWSYRSTIKTEQNFNP